MSQKRIKPSNKTKKTIASAGAATAIVLSPTTSVIAAPVQTLCTSDCVLNLNEETLDIDIDNNGTDDLRLDVYIHGSIPEVNSLNLDGLAQSLYVWTKSAVCCNTITTSCGTGWAAGCDYRTNYQYIPPLRPDSTPLGVNLAFNERFATLSYTTYFDSLQLYSWTYNAECAAGADTVSSHLCSGSCRVNYPWLDCYFFAQILPEDEIRAAEVQLDVNGTNQGWVWVNRTNGVFQIVGWGYDNESGARNKLPAPPTAVELIYFATQRTGRKTDIVWETASENETIGFNILRADSPDGPFVQINTSLIPSNGATEMGATYTFEDINTLPNTPCTYAIEEIDAQGNSTILAFPQNEDKAKCHKNA